jgi:hypothetical protein
MKKRYANGGLTQADRDAGLTEADVAAGLRAGRQSSITDAERESAIARANRLDAESIVDKYRDYNKNPEAQAIPVDMGGRRTPRAAPRPAPRSEPIQEPEMMEPVRGRASMPNEVPSGYTPAAPRRAPPSRGSYDRPGPVGDLMDIIRNRVNRPSPYRRGVRTEADEMIGAKRGGSVNKMVKKASSASKRGDGIATKGKTKGRMV